ncbi:MAG: M48 family metalloprotease [Planctomycetota bacterium]
MTAFVNNVKTAVLLGGLFGLVLVVGSQFGQGGLIVALFIGGGMNLFAFFFSDRIAIASMRGRELDETTGGDIYRMTQELSERAGLPMPRVYLCPHQAPNAFATGRSPSKAAVAVTQGAVDLLDRQEMEGVIAHELAHIKNRDTLTSTIAATVAGALAFLAQWGFFLGMGNRQGGNPLIGIVVVIIAAVGAGLLKAAISRSREFVADADGARIAGSPDGLISALLKLDAVSQRVPLQQPNPAQNNLFIIEPLSGGNTVLSLFATHPATEKRVAALRSVQL